MRVAAAALGMMIGVGGGVGITLSQAETKMARGASRRVVPTVTRARVHEVDVVMRCLWVGVPGGLVGAGIGYVAAGSGVNLGAAFLGAMILSAASTSWREHWPERFGQAGVNAQVSDAFLHGLVGGLFGAAGAAYWRKERLPGTLQAPQPADV